MNNFLFETIILTLVIVAVPVLTSALQRIFKVPLFNRYVIILIYYALFFIYFQELEKLLRGIVE